MLRRLLPTLPVLGFVLLVCWSGPSQAASGGEPCFTTEPPSGGFAEATMGETYGIEFTQVGEGTTNVDHVVNWGDGTSPENFGDADAATHLYRRPGQFPILLSGQGVLVNVDGVAFPCSTPPALFTMVRVTGPLVASFVAYDRFPGDLDRDAEFTFDATSSWDPSHIASYQWAFPDGRAGEGKVVHHIFPTGGVYDVRLTVTDDMGQTASAIASVHLGTPGQAFTQTTLSSGEVRQTRRDNFQRETDLQTALRDAEAQAARLRIAYNFQKDASCLVPGVGGFCALAEVLYGRNIVTDEPLKPEDYAWDALAIATLGTSTLLRSAGREVSAAAQWAANEGEAAASARALDELRALGQANRSEGFSRFTASNILAQYDAEVARFATVAGHEVTHAQTAAIQSVADGLTKAVERSNDVMKATLELLREHKVLAP